MDWISEEARTTSWLAVRSYPSATSRTRPDGSSPNSSYCVARLISCFDLLVIFLAQLSVRVGHGCIAEPEAADVSFYASRERESYPQNSHLGVKHSFSSSISQCLYFIISFRRTRYNGLTYTGIQLCVCDFQIELPFMRRNP